MSREAIKVYVRFRPMLGKELTQASGKCNFDFTSKKNVRAQGDNFNRVFSFDRCFPPNTANEELFNECGQRIVDQVIDGFNGTIFAYGQTGSGKTFSILGSESDPNFTDPVLKGMIPRVADCFFEKIQNLKDQKIRLTVEYCEVYLGDVFDLFSKQKKPLRIRQNLNECYIENLSRKPVNSRDQIIEYLKFGSRNRIQRKTEMNSRSSRSHTIFTIRMEQHNRFTGETKSGKFNLVDLAGSECVAKTGTKGEGLKETQKINTSLLALGNVINALVERKPHVPYRDSPLTRILQESLGGNSKTSMICCTSPHPYNFRETISTLRFGERAKRIKCKVQANVLKSREELMKIIDNLKRQLKLHKGRNQALLKEIERLRGGVKLAEDELKNLYKDWEEEEKKKKKSKKKKKNRVEEVSGDIMETNSLNSDTLSEGSEFPNDEIFDEGIANSEFKLEIKKLKVQLEDAKAELSEKEKKYEEETAKNNNEISELKKKLNKTTMELQEVKAINERMEIDISLVDERIKEKTLEKENEVIKLQEEKKFIEEDNEKLKQIISETEEKVKKAEGRLALYEQMGYGDKISDIMEESKKEITELKKKVSDLESSKEQELSQKEQEIQKLRESSNKKSNKNFKLAFDNKKVKAELKSLKKALKKADKKFKKAAKTFEKEKKILFEKMRKENEENIFKSKSVLQKLLNEAKQDIKTLKKKNDELLKGTVGVGGDEGLIKLTQELERIKKMKQDIMSKNAEREDEYLKEIKKQKDLILEMESRLQDERKKLKLFKSQANEGENEKKNEILDLKIQIKKLSESNRKYEEEVKGASKDKSVLNNLKAQIECETKAKERHQRTIELQNKKIERLTQSVIDAETNSNRTARNRYELFKKKVGTRIGMIAEMTEYRNVNKELELKVSRYEKEAKEQNEELRKKRVQIIQYRRNEKKLTEQVTKFKEVLERAKVKNEMSLREKDKVIQELRLEVEDLETKILEMEEMEKIRSRFEYSSIDNNFMEDGINDDSTFNVPMLSIPKKGLSKKKKNRLKREDSNFTKAFREVMNAKDVVDPLESFSFGLETSKEEKEKIPIKPQSITQLPSNASIEDYIRSGRSRLIMKKDKEPLKKEPEKPVNNISKLSLSNIPVRHFNTKPQQKTPKQPIGRRRLRRSNSFCLANAKNLDRKTFKRSGYQNVILKKTNHSLW